MTRWQSVALCLVIGLVWVLRVPEAHATAEAPETEIRIPAGFDSWRTGFRARALKAGISAATFDAAFDGVTPDPKVIERDAHQPEFTRPIWEYLDGAVSETRINNGREMLARHKELLSRVEDRYGVPARVIVAIWGLESSYGAIMGSYDVIRSLATLAYQGDRRRFGERELLAALRIVEAGDKSRDDLKGSWAGAMGHTQFIPSTFEAHAVDFDGDGRRDLWSSLADVFASTANYLQKSDWKKDEKWGREVKLPKGFDYAQAHEKVMLPLSHWRELGLKTMSGALVPVVGDMKGAVFLPAGHAGPAFLIYENFNAILAYNYATSYALAIGHLSDRIAGAPGLSGAWPREERLLSRTERKELQTLLNQQGYTAGPVDGVIGARTRDAVRAFQADYNLPADGFASSGFLERLREASGS